MLERSSSNLLKFFDELRFAVLRRTLRSSAIHTVYSHREYRLAVLFMLACAVYLPLALYFPLAVLAAGPVIWGFPHIISSMRYVASGVQNDTTKAPIDSRLMFALIAMVYVGVTAWRLTLDRQILEHIPGVPDFMPELAGGIIIILIMTSVRRAGFARVMGASTILGTVGYSTWHAPIATAAVLVLAHNLVAMLYWIKLSKTSRDRHVAIGATAFFSAVTAALLFGKFDFLYSIMQPQSEIVWLGLSIESLGSMALPYSDDYVQLAHAASAYAFGQAIHYFVWLKAIPEQHLRLSIPTTFTTSAKYLVRDLGRRGATAAGLLCLAGIATWCITSFHEARELYFLAAAFHGYMELVAFAFSKNATQLAG